MNIYELRDDEIVEIDDRQHEGNTMTTLTVDSKKQLYRNPMTGLVRTYDECKRDALRFYKECDWRALSNYEDARLMPDDWFERMTKVERLEALQDTLSVGSYYRNGLV